MMLFKQISMLGRVILSEGVQVNFVVNDNLSCVEFCLFQNKKYEQEAQGLSALLDKMVDNDHIKLDNIGLYMYLSQ